jgi:hypothetical protein
MPESNNALESALHTAFEEPSRRAEFYRTLMDTAVIVLVPLQTRIEVDPGTNQVLGLEMVRLNGKDGRVWVPFFSSPGFIDKLPPKFREMGKAKLMARQFFAIVQGSHCVLNPGSDLAKEFESAEVDALLSGTLFSQAGRPPEELELSFRLLKPDTLSAGTLARFQSICERHPAIRQAWLAVKKEDGSEEPTLLLLLAAEGERSALLKAVTEEISTSPASQGGYIDVHFDEGDEASGSVKAAGIRVK